MGGLEYDHVAGRRVAKRVRSIAGRAEDVTPAWPKVGAYLSRQVRRQFATRGKHFGTPWKPLKKQTRLQKTKLGFPRIPLVRTGDLRKSFIGRPMNIEIKRPQSAVFGSSLNKAVWQQFGTKRGGRPAIPPRPMLRITPVQSKEVGDIIRKFVMDRKTRS
jgi:phage gpG-like protein